MDVFSIRSIFLSRNIFDTLVSLDDHIFRYGDAGPQFQLPAGYRGWPEERRLEFLTAMAAPWYINLFMSWEECPQVLRLTYEELFEDVFASVFSVCSYVGIEASTEDVREAIARASRHNTRQNVGTTGRGKKIPENLQRRIRDMCAYYPNTDFSSILPSN